MIIVEKLFLFIFYSLSYYLAEVHRVPFVSILHYGNHNVSMGDGRWQCLFETVQFYIFIITVQTHVDMYTNQLDTINLILALENQWLIS